jgi:Flp pilus assembly secretin CpaC
MNTVTHGSFGRRVVRHVVYALVLSVAGLSAQTPGATAPQNGNGAPIHPPGAIPQVFVTAGRSTIVNTNFGVTRIAITNPTIADAVVVKPNEVLIDGKAPGTISLIVWGGGDQRMQYDVVVEQPVNPLEQQLHQLFPGEEIAVTANADALVLTGRASSTQTMLRIG